MASKDIYQPENIEPKWAKAWDESKIYKSKIDESKTKLHIMDMFPYPSGEGLHAGHAKVFGASDIYTRFKRMQGFNVLHATGWDAFGLPAEQYALKNKVNPKISTKTNTDTFLKQMKMLGFSYDYDRLVNTTDPSFYKWTQWIFKELFKAGLVYESYEPINWCPSCLTGLANEDLEDGVCERCGSQVEKKPIRQWVIKITEYAEKLLSGLDGLEWKESIKEMQRNWIGKNEGIKYRLKVKDTDMEVETYSTHFEAFYADTFAVIAADHKMLKDLVKGVDNEKEILKTAKDIVDRKTKAGFKELENHTGIFTGRFLVDPITGNDLPLWISSYALSDYGTGIIKCSAHDTRDFAFAKKYDLPLRVVMYPKDAEAKTKKEIDALEYCFNDFENAVLTLPNEFTDKNPKEAHAEILSYLVNNGYGERSTQYKLKDWVFARQRYWGEPFPIVFDENHKCYVVADSELPVVLPDVKDYEPTGNGESPLANITEWVEVYGEINKDGEFVSKKDGKKFYRETNTMPQWAGSSWYWLRYMDPHNSERLVGVEEEKYWTSNGFPVDMYIGGLEHATRHLIYGRFWNQFLFDKSVISTPEPFKRLETVGLVLGKGGVKMSKRLGNVVNPDDVVKQFGADTLRLYIAFAGDFHDSFAWDEKSIVGPRRFIERIWALRDKISESEDSVETETILHQTIKKVSLDFELLKFNTAIAQLMIFVNHLDKVEKISKETYKKLLQMLSPLAPFISEELWSKIGESESIHSSLWPAFDETKAKLKTVNIAVQINGKLRDVFEIAVDTPDEEVIATAKKTQGYLKWVGEVVPKKIIVIKNKIVNIVL